MSSAETLKLNFHPSSLLTIGDLLAFVRRLTDTGADQPDAVAARNTGPIAEKPPSMREQMALCSSVISRVPQRCVDPALSVLTPYLEYSALCQKPCEASLGQAACPDRS